MVPGFLQGTYEERELAFDLDAITQRAGARFVRAAAERIDAGARSVEAGGERFEFDVLSVDVGSQSAGLATPGAREHALTIRPMSRAVTLRQRADELLSTGSRREVVVVGGGAAGLEVALALERLGRGSGATTTVTIVEAGPGVLPEFSDRVRSIAERVLAARAVRALAGRQVTAVEPAGVILDDRTHLASDLTVWLAGTAPPRLLVRSDLPRDRGGFLLVDDALRAVDGTPVFGAGDCIGMAAHPELAKAGVFAVRQSPILEHNLRAALAGGRLRSYRPQRSFLALLNSADGRAIWRWRGLAGHSRPAWWLKHRIDRAFVRRYRQGR